MEVGVRPVSCDDFIGVYDTEFDVDALIDYHKYCSYAGLIWDRHSQGIDEHPTERSLEPKPNTRRDAGTALTYHHYVANREAGLRLDLESFTRFVRAYTGVMNYCLELYSKQFEHMHNYRLVHEPPNIQRTKPTEGYHVWHCENDGIVNHPRKLVTMMYLNDDFDGGETEFLYLSRREKPVRGRVLLWPSGWTHLHRGLPPLSGEKYIATGWMSDYGVW